MASSIGNYGEESFPPNSNMNFDFRLDPLDLSTGLILQLLFAAKSDVSFSPSGINYLAVKFFVFFRPHSLSSFGPFFGLCPATVGKLEFSSTSDRNSTMKRLLLFSS